MTPILLTGPASEPVPLALAKAWMKVDSTAEDDLIGALITSARLIVESSARRMLMTQSWRLALDAWPRGLIFEIPFAPFRGVLAVRVYDALGVAAVLAPAAYQVDAAPDRARLIFTTAPPPPGRAAAGIEIDISVGYGDRPEDVPAPLRQAIQMLAARWFEDRGDPAANPPHDVLPAAAAALIASYRRRRLA